ncbi:MAG: sulfatase [Verrucomicrobiota bacterium]|nr:sulfatase [Verrucomicrobiota bacterium]
MVIPWALVLWHWSFLLLAAFCGRAFAASPPPNLVIFLADDQGVLDCSPYGAKDVRTPNLQHLADAGLTFDRAFVASPSCAPSRAALLTGLMPARNGAEANHSKPRPELKKLPAFLKELGYEVAAFGKVSHYRHTADYGFDHFAHDSFHDPAAIPSALKWLRERSSPKPLCLFVGSNWPHVPWPENPEGYEAAKLTPPPAHVDTSVTRETRARYYAAVTRMDAELGQVRELAREKLGANTAFFSTSDHGAQWPFGKWNCYDAGVRVPLVVEWAGVIKPGARTDAMVSWVDLLPTLIELAGGQPPDLDGRSFAGVLRGKAATHRNEIFTTHSGDGKFNVYPIRSVRTAQWKYIQNLHPEFQHATHINRAARRDGLDYWLSWQQAAQTDPHAAAILKRYAERPREELYDLAADPHELRNLAADPPHTERARAMRERLEAWMDEQGDKRTVFNEPLLLGQEATPLPAGAPKPSPK